MIGRLWVSRMGRRDALVDRLIDAVEDGLARQSCCQLEEVGYDSLLWKVVLGRVRQSEWQ